MSLYSQANQPLAIVTPLGEDRLLLTGVQGVEAISEPFLFTLDLLALEPVSFDDLLGKPAQVHLRIPGSPERRLHGVIRTLEQCGRVPGNRGGITFVRYQAELVPALWLCSLRTQTRMFQSRSVPEIVRQILVQEWGFEVDMRLTGTYPPRDYCVQYQETDLAFVSRLLEDEGIAYYVQHGADAATLVLVDNPEGFATLEKPNPLVYEEVLGGRRPEGRVLTWSKRQTLRPTQVRLRDHSFQLPQSTLETTAALTDKVAVGSSLHTLRHSLNKRGSEMFEQYNPAGGYAWRFDGVSPEGNNQLDQVQQVFQENHRVADLRAGAEATAALRVEGTSNCGHVGAGLRFSLTRHFDANGDYLLNRVTHEADIASAYLDDPHPREFLYLNSLEARPASLPYRPALVTPRPRLAGVLPAKVVGPTDSEIFVDRYGRVKVKFFWDRNEQTGAMNSCWLRVGQCWAGDRWGSFFWPRVGHEVLVTFEDGNPDRPLIVGSLYNEANMPPFELPANRTLAGIKSCSTARGSAAAQPLVNYSGFVINDDAGKEHIEIHGEKHIAFFAEETERHWVDGPHRMNVNGFRSTHIGCLPGGSGSGGADPDHPFVYSDEVGSGKIGIDFTSVCGLNELVTLGLFSALTVGDYVNVVCNPLGMAADLGMAIPGTGVLTGIGSGLVAGLASPVLGFSNVVMGSQTQLNYGTNITIARGAKAPITDAGKWSPESLEPGEKPWAIATEALMGLTASMATAGVIAGSLDSYNTSQVAWEVLVGLTGAVTGALEITESFRAVYNQVAKAKQAAEAAALLAQDSHTVEGLADLLLAIFNRQNPHYASAKLVHGITAEYVDQVRILGANEDNFIFSGTQANQQSVVALRTNLISMFTGTPATGPRVKLDGAGVGSISLVSGPDDVGSAIKLSPTELKLTVGPPGQGSSITMNAQGITLAVGPCTIELDVSGLVNLKAPGSELTMAGGAVTLDANEEMTLMGGPTFDIITDSCTITAPEMKFDGEATWI
ncbi:MAG: type VI secretion system tip protein TssI/VgrG [Gemmataceae bacterium]